MIQDIGLVTGDELQASKGRGRTRDVIAWTRGASCRARPTVIALFIAVAMRGHAAANAVAPMVVQHPGEIVIRGDGNELFVQRKAPIRYTSVSRLMEDIRSALPTGTAAMRLTRAAPPEMLYYVLCVTSEGLLVLGEQRRTFKYTEGRYVFERAEIGRGYRPLEQPGPWTWILEIPVSRERRATLRLRAGGLDRLVEHVTIEAVGPP